MLLVEGGKRENGSKKESEQSLDTGADCTVPPPLLRTPFLLSSLGIHFTSVRRFPWGLSLFSVAEMSVRKPFVGLLFPFMATCPFLCDPAQKKPFPFSHSSPYGRARPGFLIFSQAHCCNWLHSPDGPASSRERGQSGTSPLLGLAAEGSW